MDIQVASNFERILFEALGRDADTLRRLYDQFAQSGGFDIPAPALAFLREHFDACSASDAETQATMKRFWNDGAPPYLACPHTSVALFAASKSELAAPSVTLATAHPAKFPETVEATLGVKPPLPAHCADLFSRNEKITALPDDVEAVKKLIRERSRAWS